MAQATASGEALPLQIELPLTYSLQKLNVELKNAGFQLDCSELDLPAGALEPGHQGQGGPPLADIASDAAAAARHASAALSALLTSNPAHSACAMLASAAQAAAAAALALVEGEDFDPELDDVGGAGAEAEGACCAACHELGDGTRCADAGCPDGAPLAPQLAASWGVLRCTAGGAELLCAWAQERGSGEREGWQGMCCGRSGMRRFAGVDGAGRENGVKGGEGQGHYDCSRPGPLLCSGGLRCRSRSALHVNLSHTRRCADWFACTCAAQTPSGSRGPRTRRRRRCGCSAPPGCAARI